MPFCPVYAKETQKTQRLSLLLELHVLRCIAAEEGVKLWMVNPVLCYDGCAAQ